MKGWYGKLACLLTVLAASAWGGDACSAAWIGEAAERPAPRFLRFSCPFEGADDPLKVTLSADQRYVLLMDGEVVGRGPAFGDLDHWHSQELELKPGKGPHLLEAVVWKLGHDGFKGDRPSAQLTWRTGFVLKAAGVYDARLTTGVAKWKVGALKGTVPAGCGAGGEAFGVGCQFEVRGTSVLDEKPDRVGDAVVIRPGDAARPSGSGVLAKGWHVRPSLLPEQLHRVIRPGETPAPFRVAAHVRVEKLFDLGNYFCAYPRLTVKGGKDARISWGWTEALRDPAIRDSYSWNQAVGVVRCSKTDRTKREGMAFSEKYAMVDTFICDGRDSALFTTPWWRCGRWCRITVETADEPLEVVDVSLDETRYPLEDESAFETDDPSLGPIGAMCVRGLQMCAHEIMYDCPFWEQQMYPGDCRVSFLAMTAMTRDDRLIRQGLELFDGARRADGSIPMNWPSNHDQHSVTWTLSWVLSVGDYARWHGDAAWLKARLPGLEHTMIGLGRHENGRGLLEDVPGWSYLDWVAEWRKDLFAPPGATAGQGESAVLNLLYLRGIRATAEALEACGETERAAYWRKKGVRLGGTIREMFWDGRTGRVADTPAKDCFSEHAQALALTCGCLSAEEGARALAALEKGGPDMAAASSFGLHFVFEAFTAAGRGDLILGKLDCWRRYAAMNMNCPLESLVFPRSDCHGFGAHPLFHFHSGVAGVTPAAPFFANVRIAPCPGRLGRIRSKTPHPKGFVETDLEFEGTAVSGSVRLPAGVTGVFVWRGEEHPLSQGLNEIGIEGRTGVSRRSSGGAVVFDRDFRTEEGDPSLDGFRIVRHYDGVGKDAIRQAQGYGIAFPLRGNVHLARMPRERDCTVDCSMYCDSSFGNWVGFDVYYRYDESTRVGGVLSVEFDRKSGQAKVRSGIVRKLAYAWKEEARIPIQGDHVSGTLEWRLEVADDTVKFGSAAFSVPDGVPSDGRIGFDKFCPSAPLVIGRLSVTGEPGKTEELFSRRIWRFPRTSLCSMSDWRFVFAATNAGPHTILNAAVEGGPAEAFNRKIGYTGHLPNEALGRPWFAVVRPDGTVEPRQYLYFGRIGYRERWCHMLPYMGKSDIECPVRRTFYLDGLSDDCRLLIGFDGFESEDRRYMGVLRKMMMVDPASGKVIATGDVLDTNGLAFEVCSGSDKRICGMIPKSTSGYEEAFDYAVRNHFFLENEPARFAVGIRQTKGRYAAGSLRVDCTLQDAFRDAVRPLRATVRSSASAFPGEDALTVEVEPLTLPVGVYHLGLEISSGEETLLRKSVAFEVMGESADAPRAQMASGLPEMMSPICDYQSESNVSDYRGMGGNDQTHYFAINGMQVLPMVEKGDWDLNNLYRRKYFGWFLHGLVPRQKPETYERHFRDIDYLCTNLIGKGRFPVCTVGVYEGELRKVLADFLREKCDVDPELSRVASDPSISMTLPILKNLLEQYGQEWLDRAAEYHEEKSTAAIGKWKGIRELVEYFTVNYYVWRCKGAFHVKAMGVNPLRHPEKTWYSGFAIVEDYPYLVGQSPLEGLYALAALKMDAPELSLAPEVKGACAIPMDPSTVYGCPPYGVMKEEDATFKRFIDFKYTACWYRDGGFRYWTDDRILLCNPSPEETANVLGAWREVRRHTPIRPVRTYAIVTGTKCCSRHPLKVLVATNEGMDFLDVVNTAEEFPFWAALAVRENGLPNGFLIRPEEIAKLVPDDVHTLILPPMDALTEEERSAVRRLHGLGVNLIASENADGMEDVFGVRRLQTPFTVESIGGEPSLTGEAAATYGAADAETLLADDAGRTVLALKSSGRASAAFYTIAPTMFSRAYLHTFPMQSGKALPRSAAEMFRRMLPSPEMSLSEGRMSVCRDQTGGLEFCVMEDAQPMPAHEIFPVLTLRGDYRKASIDSSKPCRVLGNDGDSIRIGFELAPRECVTLHLRHDKEKGTL